MSTQKVTVLYERLSVDDERQGESNSITHQRRILEEYAKRNALCPYIHISDDGWSGTRWDRPGWQELMGKIEADEVSCICIKDGSRLGRDYLRVGLYREMFREKGIRLIAINDGYDSNNGEDDFTPFREIIAEWYARDTSKKIKSVLASKGKSGKTLTNIPPYGYIKDPNDKNKWLVDPEAAAVVRRIFEMTIDGMGPSGIAKRLYDDRVERPSYYLAKRGIGRHRNKCNEEHPYAWNSSSIGHMLSRLEYCGHTVNFKIEKQSYKSKKFIVRPKEDWLIFENTHEAIVTRQTWELVQKLRETKRRYDNLGEANPLTGLMYCADCGGKLFNHRYAMPEGEMYSSRSKNFYVCSTFRRTNARYDAQCTPHIISTLTVRQIILELLRETNGYVREHEEEFIKLVMEKSALKKGETAKKHRAQIAKNERRIAELEKIFRSLYEDKALEKLDSKRFDEMIAVYEQERAELQAQTSALRNELDAFNADIINVDRYIELVHRFTTFDELTPAMINEFVDKIIVHEGEWSEGRNPKTGRGMGTRTQKVEVYLKYIGCFNIPDTRTDEEIEAERVKQERHERDRKQKREYARRRRKKLKEDGASVPKPAA